MDSEAACGRYTHPPCWLMGFMMLCTLCQPGQALAARRSKPCRCQPMSYNSVVGCKLMSEVQTHLCSPNTSLHRDCCGLQRANHPPLSALSGVQEEGEGPPSARLHAGGRAGRRACGQVGACGGAAGSCHQCNIVEGWGGVGRRLQGEHTRFVCFGRIAGPRAESSNSKISQAVLPPTKTLSGSCQ